MNHTLNARRSRWLATILALGMYVSMPAKTASAACWSPFVTETHEALFNQSGWNCNQTFVNFWWSTFNFHNWGDFGYDNPCANWTPLGRTFNGLFALGYSSTGGPHCNNNAENVTEWAMCWSMNQITRLEPDCGNHANASATSSGRVKVYRPFYNNNYYNPVQRAGTIFHEARHASGCAHNASDSSCPRGASCDKSWTNGCPASGKDDGANRFHVTYLAWYLATATRINATLRDLAQANANSILADAFKTKPCHSLDSYGYPVQEC